MLLNIELGEKATEDDNLEVANDVEYPVTEEENQDYNFSFNLAFFSPDSCPMNIESLLDIEHQYTSFMCSVRAVVLVQTALLT
ncbi:hypothetical protein QYF36_004960 [Acer negundo]|nr:hypothetical protein QYF36_004960 [Acer negundo]